jgi:hypothetical protein
MLKKKIWPIFKELWNILLKNLSPALKNMSLGSKIRKKPIPDPGVKKAPDPESGSATLLHETSGLTQL